MRTLVALVVICLGLADTAYGQRSETDGVGSWKCQFAAVASASWTADPPKPVIKAESFSFHIDGVDFEKNRARMIGNAGASDIIVLKGRDLVSFLEVTTSGNPLTTSVFAPRLADGTFRATHSRHVNMDGGPVVSQYYGYCLPW